MARFEAAAAGDIGVVGLEAAFSNASWPSDRFRDSCTLNMSSCIDERIRAGVPKLFDLLDRPGLEGVEGDGNDVVVAVLGREDEAGEEVVIGEGRSLVRRLPCGIVRGPCGASFVIVVAAS